MKVSGSDRLGEVVSPEQAMELAIQQAYMGLGRVQTNPLVGCTIVSQEGRLISFGYHSAFGKAHAEVDALGKIKDKSLLHGAKVFVTLEPCSHVGKTPSCAHTLAQLPIHSVIYGCKDPHPMAHGGHQVLMDARIKPELYQGHLEEDLEELNEPFLHNCFHQRAFVGLKVATSLDGALSLKSGESQWISNAVSRQKGHELRVKFDATLIGVQTYLNDDPHLNIRHPDYKGYPNKVIILDPHGKSLSTLHHSRLFKAHKPEDIYIVTTQETSNCSSSTTSQIAKGRAVTENKSSLGVQLHYVKEGSPIDLLHLCQELYQKFSISSILVEGGANTHSHFIHQKAAQKVYQFIAPILLGGVQGLSWTRNLSILQMKDKVHVDVKKIDRLDEDFLIMGNFRY